MSADEALHPAAVDAWPRRLEPIARRSGWRSVVVLDQTESTQDAARRLNARPGDVIVSWRQTSGRGRLGRPWADTGDEGVAMTMVLEAGAPERTAIAAAVAVADALQPWLEQPVGIKWPNDIIVSDRKLAGILIERDGDRALVGVGVNVLQQRWPEALAHRAVSLKQLGAAVDRLDVMISLLGALPRAIAMTDDQVTASFAARDVLTGRVALLRCGDRTVRGEVVRVDPLQGLAVDDHGTPHWFPAATTTLLELDPSASGPPVVTAPRRPAAPPGPGR